MPVLALVATVNAADTGSGGRVAPPGRIDPEPLDRTALQRLLDEGAASTCSDGASGCRWRVVSLYRSNDPVAPAPDAGDARRFDASIPAGFEALAAMRHDVFEVYADGVPIVRAPAGFDSATLRFDDPVAVAEAFGTAGFAGEAPFGEFLAAAHPVDPDGVCVDDSDPYDCSTRERRDFALVPDLSRRRLDLAVRASVRQQDRAQVRRLPPAQPGLDTRIGAYAAIAALTGQDTVGDVSLDGSLSYGAGGVFGTMSYGSTDGLARVGALFGAHQFDDHVLRLGTVESDTGGLLFGQRLIGVEWARSFDTWLDTPTLFATPVLVELRERSVVQLVVDGEVRHSETLGPGLREVRSDTLPEGTYPLEIRIRDTAAGLTTETRAYSRSRLLPPPGRPVYGVMAGSPRDPDRPHDPGAVNGRTLVSAHLGARIGARGAFRLQASGYGSSAVAQLQLSHLGNRHRLQVDGLAGSRSAIGAALQASWRGRRFGVSVQGLSFRSDRDPDDDPEVRGFFRPDTRAVGASFDIVEGPWSLGLRVDRASTTIDGFAEARDRRSVSLRRRLVRGAGIDSAIDLRYLDSGEGARAEIRFTLDTRRGTVRQRLSQSLDRQRSGEWEPSLDYAATWLRDGAAHTSPRPAGRHWSTTLEASTRPSGNRLGVSATVTDPSIELGVAADAIDPADTDRAAQGRALLTFGGQLASDGATLAAGRPQGHGSGIIVDVRPGRPDDDPSGDETFDIIVDGRNAGTGRVGTRRFIGLPPYRTHQVALVPRSLAFNGLGDDVSMVTLYPGNVERLQVETEQRYLLVTRLADAAGGALTNVLLRHGDTRYFVLDDGIVQLEVKAGSALDIDLEGGGTCRARAPDPAGERIVVTAAPLPCR